MIKKDKILTVIILLCFVMLVGCKPELFANKISSQMEYADQNAAQTMVETEKQEVLEKQAVTKKSLVEALVPKGPLVYYAYETLDEQQKQIYNEIYTALLKCEESTDLSTVDTEALNFIFNCVMNDHPELFYVDGYQYKKYTIGSVTTQLSFAGNYNMTPEEIQTNQTLIGQCVEQILAQVPQTDDEYELVKAIYEYIIAQTEYNLLAENNQNVCSVFLNHQSVCQGYAKAFQYLLQKLNIESVLITGTANQDGHAWNLVKVNGNYYYVDVTWGDASYTFAEHQEETQTPPINYDYLLVTTQDLCQTHRIDETITLPNCTETADNYYVREGLFLDTYDEIQIQHIFETARLNNNSYITLKCMDDTLYEEVRRKLMEEQRVFEFIMDKGDKIAYTENQQQRTISFWI